MRRPACEGLLALVLLIVMTSSLGSIYMPSPIETAYTRVEARVLSANPSQFEGRRVSLGVTISRSPDPVSGNTTYNVEEGFSIECSEALGHLRVGDAVALRGVCRLETLGVIIVEELHVSDELNPLLRSALGLVLFVVMLFSLFRFDLKRIAFIPRRK